MSMNVVTLLYLVASVCFIQALKGLSHPTTSIRGNLFGMVGMAIAVVTTAMLIVKLSEGNAAGMVYVLAALVAADASALYARNVLDFLKLVLTKEGTFNVPMDDDIVAACLMTQAGEVKRKYADRKSVV